MTNKTTCGHTTNVTNLYPLLSGLVSHNTNVRTVRSTTDQLAKHITMLAETQIGEVMLNALRRTEIMCQSDAGDTE